MISHSLPPKWSLRGEYLESEDGVERYVRGSDGRLDRAKVALILSNYGYKDYAAAFELGADLIGLLRRARCYINEVGSIGKPGDEFFKPNLSDPQTKLAREIDAILKRDDR